MDIADALEALQDHIKLTKEDKTFEYLQSLGVLPQFCLGCLVKHAAVFKKEQDSDDLLKLAHYALMLWTLNEEKDNAR